MKNRSPPKIAAEFLSFKEKKRGEKIQNTWGNSLFRFSFNYIQIKMHFILVPIPFIFFPQPIKKIFSTAFAMPNKDYV